MLTSAMWHSAHELAAQFMDDERFENVMWRQWRRDWEAARKEITSGLMMIVKEDLDPCNERLPEILKSSLSPADIRRIVWKLQEIHWGPSPSPARASTWSGDLEPPVPEPPRVSVAAAPVAESVTASAALVDPVVASGSNVPVIIDDSVPGPPVTDGDDSSNSPRWDGTVSCAMPPFCPGNIPPCKADGSNGAHYERVWPPQEQLSKIPSTLNPDCSLRSAHEAGKRILSQWLALRPRLAAQLFPPEERPYVWFDISDGSPMTEIHNVGCWLYFGLKTPNPPYPEGTTTENGRPFWKGQAFTETVHACSMYTVYNSIVEGLKSGPPGKGGLVGVYCYRTTATASICKSSSGYRVYEHLCGCEAHNIFFGPTMVLECELWRAGDPGIGPMAAGAKQLCVKPGCFHLKGMYVHIMTPEDLMRLPENHLACYHGYNTGRMWNSRYECGDVVMEV